MRTEPMQTYESSYTPPRPRKKRLFWALIGVAGFIVIIIAIAGAWVVFALRPLRIDGLAMSPTLNHNDKVFMLKQVGELQRGDIVVFLYPEDQTKSYIGRIVGLPGETIEVKDGKVYINGNPIEEPYLAPEYASHDTMPEPFAIPPDNYFVLGDNRRNSSDSRYWGPLPRKLIYGKFWYRYAEG